MIIEVKCGGNGGMYSGEKSQNLSNDDTVWV